MKGRIFYFYLVGLLSIAGLTTDGFAQTGSFTGVSITQTSVCAGSSLTVTFTTSGTFTANTVFTAQLSDATGFVSISSPVVIGTFTKLTAGTISTGAITTTIPLATSYGLSYRIKVINSNNNSNATLGSPFTIGVPPPGVTNPAAFCEGTTQSLSLNATGQNLKWYGINQTGGTASGTAPSVTTAGTYYVSQTINDCESSRAAIIVTIKDTPKNPTAPSPQTTCAGDAPKPLTATPSDNGKELYWYIDPTGGTGNKFAPTPSANSTYYVSQKNTTSGCESGRTKVDFNVISLPKAPTVTTPAATCAGNTLTDFKATPDTGGILQWWTNSNKTSAGPSTPSTTQSATYYVSQEVNGCDGPTAPISVTIVAKPDKPTVKGPPAVCSGSPVGSLTATTTSSAYTLRWWGTSSSSVSYSTTAPSVSNTQSATYYVSQATKEGCDSERAGIVVTINTLPPIPSVTTPDPFCLNKKTDRKLSATATAGATLNWFDAAGAIVKDVPPSPSTAKLGDVVYYVSQSYTSNGCTSAQVKVTAVVNAVPAQPAISTPSAFCSGQSAQPLSATGVSLKWYGRDSTNTNPSSSFTPEIGTAFIGANNYYVTQTVAGCESNMKAIVVTVKKTPDKPATKNSAFCQNSTAIQPIATPDQNATLNWWGESASGGSRSDNLATIPNDVVKLYTYYVSQTLNGCESGLGTPAGRASVTAQVYSTPNEPGVKSFSLCNNGPAQPLTATGTNLKWYDNSDKLLGSTYTPITNTVGSQVYKVTQESNLGCVSTTASLTVTITPLPGQPTVANFTYCQIQQDQPTQNVTSLALNASGQALKWYTSAGTLLAGAPTPSITNAGTQSYQVSQTISNCEGPKATIQVTINSTAAPILPKSLVTYCVSDKAVPLQATGETGGQLRWIDPAGKTTNDAPTPATTSTNTQLGGDSFYVYQIGSNSCYSSRSTIKVVVNPLPSAPNVNSISFCNKGTSDQLTASGINLKWYGESDNLLGTVAPKPSTDVAGNQTYKVSQTSNLGCEGPKAILTVTINALPAAPNTTSVNYCQTQQDQPPQNVSSIASNASGQNLRWYNTDGNQFPNAPIPAIDKAGTQTYKVSQTVNSCEGPKADLVVTVNTIAAPTTPKPLVVYCVNDKVTPLEAIGETGSQLKWIDPYGRVTSDAPSPATANTNVQPGGDPFYVYQIGTNGCYSSRATVKVVVTSPPTLGLVAPTSTVNLGQKAPLRLKFTSSGPFSYTITGGYTGTSLSADTTIFVLPRGNTIYQIVTVSNGCGVGLPGNPATAQVNVIVPTVATSSLATTTLCSGTSLAVPFTTSGQFNSGNIFRIEMVSSADTSKKYAVAATANSSPITGILPTTLPGGQYFVRVKADNPEIAIIGSNSPTQLTVRSVASATLTGSQTIYEGTPANLTLTFGGDGPWTTTYADSLRTYSATTSSNPYVFEARPTQTTTYRLTNVTNVCGNGPISGGATITVSPLLSVDDNSLDPLVKTYPVPTQTILRVELDLPLTRDPAILSLIDAGGRPVLQQNTRTQLNELDLTTQPNGLYFLRIQVGDRQTVRKVIKQ